MFAENALIMLGQGSIQDFILKSESWQERGFYHLNFEKWDKFTHSRPFLTKGYGGRLKVNKLP